MADEPYAKIRTVNKPIIKRKVDTRKENLGPSNKSPVWSIEYLICFVNLLFIYNKKMSSLAFAAKQAQSPNPNPFAFKFSDDSIRKENAVNYIPPNKRK